MNSKPKEKMEDVLKEIPPQLGEELTGIAIEFVSFASSKDPLVQAQFRTLYSNARQSYNKPKSIPIVGRLYSRTRLRDTDLKAHLESLEKNSESTKNLQTFADTIADGERIQGSFNTYFMDELFAALFPEYLKQEGSGKLKLFEILSRLVLALIPESLFILKNRSGVDRELEEKNAGGKKNKLDFVHICREPLEALAKAKSRPELSVFCVQLIGEGIFSDYNACDFIKLTLDPVRTSFFKLKSHLQDKNTIILYDKNLFYVQKGTNTVKVVLEDQKNSKQIALLKSVINENRRDATEHELNMVKALSDEKHWKLTWITPHGRALLLEPSKELKSRLSLAEDLDQRFIQNECLKARDIILNKIHVLINSPLTNKDESTFILHIAPETYPGKILTWYDHFKKESREIHLNDYPMLSEWIDDQIDNKTNWDEKNILTLKILLQGVNVRQAFEDTHNIKKALENCYGDTKPKTISKPNKIDGDRLNAMNNSLFAHRNLAPGKDMHAENSGVNNSMG